MARLGSVMDGVKLQILQRSKVVGATRYRATLAAALDASNAMLLVPALVACRPDGNPVMCDMVLCVPCWRALATPIVVTTPLLTCRFLQGLLHACHIKI